MNFRNSQVTIIYRQDTLEFNVGSNTRLSLFTLKFTYFDIQVIYTSTKQLKNVMPLFFSFNIYMHVAIYIFFFLYYFVHVHVQCTYLFWIIISTQVNFKAPLNLDFLCIFLRVLYIRNRMHLYNSGSYQCILIKYIYIYNLLSEFIFF